MACAQVSAMVGRIHTVDDRYGVEEVFASLIGGRDWLIRLRHSPVPFAGQHRLAHAPDPHRLVRWVNEADRLRVKAHE